MPGALKNATDWSSRPLGSPPDSKPVAILGPPQAGFGPARAQYHLRKSCPVMTMLPVNNPELFIARAQERFDGRGRLIDEAVGCAIQAVLGEPGDWTLRLARPHHAS